MIVKHVKGSLDQTGTLKITSETSMAKTRNALSINKVDANLEIHAGKHTMKIEVQLHSHATHAKKHLKI